MESQQAGPLPVEDVERLPDGTRIRVTWCGGNGPHEYVIAVDRHGGRYAARNVDPDDPFRWYNRLTFVGVERYHTRVWADSVPAGVTPPAPPVR